MNISLDVNGFAVDAHFDDASVRVHLLPLLDELTRQQKALGRRLVALLAAPPGAGKSTLAAFLERLSRSNPNFTPIQALGMDGFHFHQDHILSHSAFRDGVQIPMRLIKGAPETFDVQKLRRALEDVHAKDVLWPRYDRRLHDVVENAAFASASILLVEGNWLLLNRPEWRDLPGDVRIFIDAQEHLLRSRLIERKMRGGASLADAEAHYARTDGPNVRLCREHRLPADFTFIMTGDGTYRKG